MRASQKSDQETSKPGQRSTYRPDSYTEIVNDATTAIVSALEAGEGRMEVEFPSVANVSGYAGSSDLFIDSSIQLSISMARKLHATTGKLVHIVLPDGPEYNRAYKLFRSALDASEGVTLGHLRERQKNTFLSALAVSFSMTGETPPDSSECAENAEVFVAVNASTVELPELERYALETVRDRKLITWNMELDNLRADLGLLGFPPKDLQYRFLSTIKPVFYIRQRDYSKTVSVSPFIINYSGRCLGSIRVPGRRCLGRTTGRMRVWPKAQSGTRSGPSSSSSPRPWVWTSRRRGRRYSFCEPGVARRPGGKMKRRVGRRRRAGHGGLEMLH